MMPRAKAMIQQPRVPSSGLMPASDVLICANEVIKNRDTLVKLLSRHTGNVQGACNFKLWHDLLGKGSERAVARELKFSDIVTLSHHGERRASLSSGPSNREILDMVAYGGDVSEQPESVVTNHGISTESTQKFFAVAREFFHLPAEEKMRFYSMTHERK